MRLTHLLIAGSLLTGTSLAQADERAFGNGTLPTFLQEYDVNEDGKIDEEERQAFKEARKATRDEHRTKIDTNGDGEISDAERQAARDAIRAAIEAKRAEKFAEIAGDDGLLTLEELAAVPHLERVPEESHRFLHVSIQTKVVTSALLNSTPASAITAHVPTKVPETVTSLTAVTLAVTAPTLAMTALTARARGTAVTLAVTAHVANPISSPNLIKEAASGCLFY